RFIDTSWLQYAKKLYFTTVYYLGEFTEGVESHEDLPSSRIAPGADFYSGYPGVFDSDPSPGFRYAHGMACAGIVAATHCVDSTNGLEDSSGVFSLNGNVQIVPIKMAGDSGGFLDPINMAYALAWAFTEGEADIFYLQLGLLVWF
ncbi:MAG: hypothetical protein P1R58_11830, partial [bacterium]|nr:hypothetical protein [bacterium]